MEVEFDDVTSVNKKIKHNEDVTLKNVENSGSTTGTTSASLNSEILNGSNSDMSYQDDENEGDGNEGDEDDADLATDDDCDVSDYGGDDFFYADDDEYLSIQAQFDNVDLPTGVEASVSWIKNTAPNPNSHASTSASTSAASPGGMAKISSCMTASTSSLPCAESSSSEKEKGADGDEIMRKYETFKQFDIVNDFSDHHYKEMGLQGQQPSRAWSKKVQDEWKILEKDLPTGNIYVRVYESRMDLLRAIIVGPQGTPYHDGLFVFDVVFPPNYPNIPPMVHYHSGGLRLNPNLYDCGKVCLSLLNTWTGNGNEKWVPQSSTMLQVLVSIQALILNAKPFFNEPGYDTHYVGAEGERRSKEYSENVLILSLKTMMYTLRRPPKHFEDLVAGHFRAHAHVILASCRAYMEGALVGSLVNGKVLDGSAPIQGGSSGFKAAVKGMVNGLVNNFTKNGVPDCEKFRVQ